VETKDAMMFFQEFKTARRSLSSNKGFTAINIAGLTLGFIVFILIGLYVQSEFSYDRYNSKANRIFRLNTDLKYGETFTSRAIAPPVAASEILKSFPEVENTVRLFADAERFKKGNQFIAEDKGAFADSTLFNVFTLPAIQGNPTTMLASPNAIVLTESMARKYFNDIHVIGKTMSAFNDDNGSITSYRITGVIKDIPQASHFRFDFIISMASFDLSRNENFAVMQPFHTYLLLKPGANPNNVEARFPDFVRRHLDFIDALDKSGDFIHLNLTPLTEIHLHSNRSDELEVNGSITYARIFLAIGIFILLIASFNFMNLSTARSADRAREVGVRKVLGSSRNALTMRFVLESVIITGIAVLFAFVFSLLLLPAFNSLSGKEIQVSGQVLAWLLPSLFLVALVTGLLNGVYPAFFLSAFRPIDTLKGITIRGFSAASIRNALVTFQFSATIFLMIAALAINSQLHFIQHKDIGFDKEQVLIIKNTSLLGAGHDLLKQKTHALPGVISASYGSFIPTDPRRWRGFLGTEAGVFQSEFWPVDDDYIGTMGMHLVQGRNFSTLLASDTASMIINETAIKTLGFNDRNVLNKKVSFIGHDYYVIGVVKDFNFNSLRENIAPVALVMPHDFRKLEGDDADKLSLRIHAGSAGEVIENIHSIWRTLEPAIQFEYSFMDEDFNRLYVAELRTGNIFNIFTGIGIFIACLGLFSLSAYAAERRTKEISIRKVLGADTLRIVGLLSKDFLQLICMAIIIGSLLGWIYINYWLGEFAYRVNIHWWIFAATALAVLVIALTTIMYQSMKAALADPVKGLRTE
jgi:putative ABC transport system permease protein